MEREARYAAVGAFVLLVIAMAALFVYWYADSRERRTYVRYEVYFDGTVSGLARGAPVRYLGVEVGRVVRMRIDPRNSSRVEVVVDMVGDVSTRVTRILSDRNISAIGGTLDNINQASARLTPALQGIQTLTADLRGASAQISAAADSVRGVADKGGPELLTALQHIRVVADNLASTSAKLDQLVQDNRQDVRVFARDGLPELERLLREGRAAALEFRELSHALREDPSRLLYQPQSRAVEIPQ